MVFLNLQIQDIISGLEAAGWNPSALPPDAIVTFSATAPTTPSDAQLWFSSITNVLSIWNGTEWQAISLTAEQEALALDLVTNGHYNKNQLDNLFSAKQNVLVSGVGIKTVNSQSLLGSGDISISATVSTLDAIGDVNLPTQTAQDYLYFDGAQWTSKQHNIDALTNVTTTTPTNGQALVYNSTTLEWENQTLPSIITSHTGLTDIGTNSHAQIDTALTRLANTSGTNTGDQDLSGYALTTHNHTGVYEPADATILKDADIGVTVQAYNANNAVLNVAQTFSGAQTMSTTTLTYAASITPDFAVNSHQKVTLTGNVTIANPTSPIEGQTGTLKITQDATGGRTVAWGTYYKWEGGVAPTYVTTANSISTYAYKVESATAILLVPLIDWK